jgi:peptide/nickel transport system permease protein
MMLHWSLAWEAVRTGAWWAFVPPTLLLTLIAFSLLMMQSSLDEVFNPRLRRGSAKLRKRRTTTPASGGGSVADADQPASAPVGPVAPAAPVVSGVRSDRTAEA